MSSFIDLLVQTISTKLKTLDYPCSGKGELCTQEGSVGGQEDISYTRVEPTVLVEIESRKEIVLVPGRCVRPRRTL